MARLDGALATIRAENNRETDVVNYAKSTTERVFIKEEV